MEAMQQQTAEVNGGAEEVLFRDLVEDLEEAMEQEEPLMKRRSNTRSDERVVPVDSSTTSSETSDAGDATPPPELVAVDELPAHAAAGDSVQKNGGSEIDWSQLNIKREELSSKFKDADIEDLISAAINGREIAGKQIEYREGTSEETVVREGEDLVYEMEESDEEVVELEFETAVEKMHSHQGYGMYCPNCSSQITKVVLRRKIRKRKVLVAAGNERQNLVGCLSCFSIFIPSGNKLNPFRIFAGGDHRDETSQLQEQPQTTDVAVPKAAGKEFDPFWFWRKRRVDANGLTAPLLTAEAAASEVGDHEADQQADQPPEELPVSDVTMAATDKPQAKGKGFGLFRLFTMGGDDDKNALTSPLLAAAAQIHSSSPAFTSTSVAIQQSSSVSVSSKPRDEVIEQENDEKSDSNETSANESVTTSVTVDEHGQSVRNSEGTASIATFESVSQTSQSQGSILHKNVVIDMHEQHGGDVRIPILETPLVTISTRSEIVTFTRTSWPMDILKSIVYGGLMESITSLLVVSLATSLNATTKNVMAIGLAFLVGGFIFLLHNLRALRYGDSSQTSEQRYNDQLGRQSRFPLHTIVAAMSYIVCGLMPPLIYNFTFRDTNDWEMKMVAVLAASFVCIFVLAIAQAYVRGENRFMAYFKTAVYYIVLAAIASAAAFGIGYLLKDPLPCPAVLVNSI